MERILFFNLRILSSKNFFYNYIFIFFIYNFLLIPYLNLRLLSLLILHTKYISLGINNMKVIEI